ncbi:MULTISPECIES: DUF4411 family protein [Enterococcus]|uniref:DUF4411 family protein n=1 Tax=Enterococcus dongliensis TaxID=2559925 RepID=A0ABU3ES92_9ENTE|nr:MULTISPECIES: DUF4411 family protein [Enterococcus]MBU5366787.1 DUF4411 family protein [Enterococcus devriesei]MDT2597739.1 DUF4411 family protein [Enterococcus dongliensis]MDT2648492.1 DUF4411 family protein [Enterococcus dongliensis]
MNNDVEKFLIDSNAFITPHRNYYQFSFAPTFWELLNQHCSSGKIMTLDMVMGELCREKEDEKKDDMQIWLESSFTGIPVSSKTQDVLTNYAIVMNHLQIDDKYLEDAAREWSDVKVADPWLIAVAKTYGYTIVSFEKRMSISSRNPTKRAKIPNICDDFGIKYCNLFDMMKVLKFRM